MEPGRRPSVEAELAALAPLAEPLRRRLYLYVSASPAAVGRDEAAWALGIARPLAAFHLDRLLRDGLLQTEFMRRSGRTGPGAGRPAKLYRRSAQGHAVSLPPRNYELAARLFADALTAPEEGDQSQQLQDHARAYGQATGKQLAIGRSPDTTAESAAPTTQPRTDRTGGATTQPPADGTATATAPGPDDSLAESLARQVYEPRLDGDSIRLGNCPSMHSWRPTATSRVA